MKILLSSHLFAPSVGGIETVSQLLAECFSSEGHEVKIVTQTESAEEDAFGYSVFRNPRATALLGLVTWCDVFLHNNISLGTAWPLLLVLRPWIVVHQTWIAQADGRLTWQDQLKRLALRHATNISISRVVADSLPTHSVVIENPYDDALFQCLPNVERDCDLVFLGRLVSDKGVDVLLESMTSLREAFKLRPTLTIIGEGPERQALEQQIRDCGLSKQVRLVGLCQNKELVEELNRHKILVVPSRWREPFGVVALEGIACGCVVIGSEEGGLAEAIGPCGVTFPNGDALALAEGLKNLLASPHAMARCRAGAERHLRKHSKSFVGKAYLNVLRATVDSCDQIRQRSTGSAPATL